MPRSYALEATVAFVFLESFFDFRMVDIMMLT